MRKEKKNNPDKLSERPYIKPEPEDKNQEKRQPNPDDPYEQTGPPIKEMPSKGSSDHPHHEEILDSIPE